MTHLVPSSFHGESLKLIAALTGAGGSAGKRSLHVRIPVSGRVPCSGARRQGKALDEVSAAIPRDAVARNNCIKAGYNSVTLN